jgi:hypothetical protein
MSTSAQKVAANRENGKNSHGPKDTTSTRFNATRHGLLAIGITEHDDVEGCRDVLRNLTQEKNPVGPVEKFLVEAMALDMMRCRRARRIEAECITGELHPPTITPGFSQIMDFDGPTVSDPGIPAPIGFKSVQHLVTLQRYESTFSNRVVRSVHELERLQRMRQGEHLPAPAAVDVHVHVEPMEEPIHSVPEAAPGPLTLEADQAEIGKEDIIAEAQERPESLLQPEG